MKPYCNRFTTRQLIYVCFLLLTPAFVQAQHKATSKAKKVTTSKAVEHNTPKQVPGTEGQKTHDEAKINSLLPSFQFVTPAKIFLTEKDIPKNQSVIFALFNPTCDHCINAAKDVVSKMDSLQNTTIFFVTFTSNFNDLGAFITNTNAGQFPNFHVCAAEQQFILNHFMPNYIMPQIMIYNKQHKLKKIFYEKIEKDQLIGLLNKL